MKFNLTYKPFGSRAILVEWPAKINETILKDVINFKKAITKNNIKHIIEVKYAYNSLLISYDSVCRNFENDIFELKSLYIELKHNANYHYTIWHIPVCYDLFFGVDLEQISQEKKISINEIIKRHSQPLYTIYFIGFLPGFLYLGGLDEVLFYARKETPRQKIMKGSVAIGGSQTGVYPSESPGGWNIIGNSPVDFFNPNLEKPCFAQPLDCIKFFPIDLATYQVTQELINNRQYLIEKEVVYG